MILYEFNLSCSRQPGSYECGYYIMRHMHRIIYVNIVDSWDMVICTIYKSHLKYLSLKDCQLFIV